MNKILRIFFNTSLNILMSVGVAITWTGWGIGLHGAWVVVRGCDIHGLARVAGLVGIGVIVVAWLGSAVGILLVIWLNIDFTKKSKKS